MINNLTTLDRLRQRITRDDAGNVTIETLDGVTPVHTLTLTNAPTGPTPNEVGLIANSILAGLATGAGLSLAQQSTPSVTGVVASAGSGDAVLPDGKKSSIRKKVTLLIHGQSNERGNVLATDRAAYPQAFESQRNKSLIAPMPGVISSTNAGGWWFKVYDDLWDAGYQLQFVNMARGSLSLVKELAGQVQFRNNSTVYDRARDSIGFSDLGYFGDVMVMGGKVFKATVGREHYMQYDGINRIPGANTNKLDYRLTIGTQTSAASDPGGWSSATLGSTNVDGGITWTCIDATNSVGYTGGQIFSSAQDGFGFDPYGLLADGQARANRITDSEDKYVYICNGQSDTGNLQSWYYNALVNISTYYLARGWKVIIGLSCYNPSGNNIAGYDMMTAARADALTFLKTNYVGKVFDGANLYQLMGTTGNMAAGGAWMQADNVHLNGAGVINGAGPHVSAAILSAFSEAGT